MTPIIDVCRAGRVEIPIMYLDNHVLGVVKPRNMLAQGDMTGDEDLLTALKGYIGRRFDKPGNVYLGLVHRLDRPVGGVMVLARTSKAAARLSAEIAAHTVDKTYLCVVRGRMEGEATLTDWLYKDERTGMVSVCDPDRPGAKRASLVTKALASYDGLTLCAVTLLTGRPHQIRVQHAHAGFPLWGDARYGRGKPGEPIALWAYRLRLTHPTLKTELTLAAIPPLDGGFTPFKEEIEALL